MSDLNGHLGRTGEVRLRPYQEQAIAKVHARVAAGVKRLVIVAPTGSGKTTIAAHLIVKAVERDQRVLFMAHRRELISQAYNRLLQFGIPEDQLGVVMGTDKRRRPGARVQVASVATLRNRPKPHADIVFVDECHRSISKSYRDIAAHYPKALHLGLTATPYRANGAGLSDAYDELIQVSSPKELIAQGFLVEPRVFTAPPDALPDLSGVRTKRGDYDQKTLADAVDDKALVGNLVDHWMRHAKGMRTVAFAVSVAHSQHITEQFKQAGVAAEHLDGETPSDERAAMLARLELGAITVLVNCGVLAEGWDQPSVKCAILARPTRSTGLYLQQAGRILRPWNGQQAIILDHGGCVLQHGLPQDDRQFSLKTRKKRSTNSSAPVRTCPSCFAVLALSKRMCPECGEALSGEPDEMPDERDGTLIEVSHEDLKRFELEKLHKIALERGYKPGWIYYRYKEKFGEAPPRLPVQPRAATPALKLNQEALNASMRGAIRSGKQLSWTEIDRALRGKRGRP